MMSGLAWRLRVRWKDRLSFLEKRARAFLWRSEGFLARNDLNELLIVPGPLGFRWRLDLHEIHIVDELAVFAQVGVAEARNRRSACSSSGAAGLRPSSVPDFSTARDDFVTAE